MKIEFFINSSFYLKNFDYFPTICTITSGKNRTSTSRTITKIKITKNKILMLLSKKLKNANSATISTGIAVQKSNWSAAEAKTYIPPIFEINSTSGSPA